MKERKVLMIVDDDKDDRFFFRNAVKEINEFYECCEAQNGIEALEQLRNADILPDFIFLDLNMPLINGWECLAELKEDKKLKNIPVIIYSTSDYQKDIDRARKLGAGYLNKSADIFRLPEKIVRSIQETIEYINY